jgi:hydroxymethylpyrimidine/phosphomethylpyrimidine kinase
MIGRILAIGGSDSGGGAGIQADIKTVTALAAYASTAITALTAQDTRGVHAVHQVKLDFLRLQIELALADPGADMVKTGMLGDEAVIGLVCDLMPAGMRLVVDPVMQAKGGFPLQAAAARDALRNRLLPIATVLTPNVPEAEILTGLVIADQAAMVAAAERLRGMGAAAVLLKGGHMPGETVVDVLVTAEGVELFSHPRIASRHTHGTGCTLASAVAAGLAQGMELRAAVRRARAFVRAAIETAPCLGVGHGPLNHAITLSTGSEFYHSL